MRAEWLECGLTDNGTEATLLVALSGPPDEIEPTRRLVKEGGQWSAFVSPEKGRMAFRRDGGGI